MLTKKEIILLSNMRKNSRQSLRDLSKTTKIPISTIYDKLRIYEKDIIKRYTTILDFQKLGYNIRAQVLLKLENQAKKEFQNYIVGNNKINNVFKTNNGYDFIIDIISKEMTETEKFIENLEEKFPIKRKHISYIVGELKTEGFMENPEYFKY